MGLLIHLKVAGLRQIPNVTELLLPLQLTGVWEYAEVIGWLE